jgi:hypothetical protein
MEWGWVFQPWPWFVAGPILGLFVPALLLAGNKPFGVASNLRHLCSALAPGRVEFFRYDWRARGGWNLSFLSGQRDEHRHEDDRVARVHMIENRLQEAGCEERDPEAEEQANRQVD